MDQLTIQLYGFFRVWGLAKTRRTWCLLVLHRFWSLLWVTAICFLWPLAPPADNHPPATKPLPGAWGGGSLAGSPAFTLVLTPPRKQRTISKLHLQFWGCAYLSILGPCESSSVPSVPRPTPHRRLKKSSSALHIPTSATDVIPALWMHDCLPLLTMLCFFFLHIMEGRLRHFYPPSLTWVG